MVLVDFRKGSGELIAPLRRTGLDVAKSTLPCADIHFEGNGPSGRVLVGIERKRVSEIEGCLGGDKRFISKQLPALLKKYGAHAWLVVEGYAAPGHDGSLQLGGYARRPRMYRDFAGFLLTQQTKSRVLLARTAGLTETVYWIHALYSWYQKPWASHHSCFQVEEALPDAAILEDRGTFRSVVAQLPGVGWTLSLAVMRHFPNLLAAFAAPRREWASIPGIGPLKSRAIHTAIRRLHDGRSD